MGFLSRIFNGKSKIEEMIDEFLLIFEEFANINNISDCRIKYTLAESKFNSIVNYIDKHNVPIEYDEYSNILKEAKIPAFCLAMSKEIENISNKDVVNDKDLAKLNKNLNTLSTIIPEEHIILFKESIENLKVNSNKNDNKIALNFENYYSFEIGNHIRIIEESFDIISNTTNVDTFFSRYDLLVEKLDEVEYVVDRNKKLKSDSNFIKLLSNIKNATSNIDSLINNLIDRKYQKIDKKLSTMKRKSDIERNIQNFCDDFKLFSRRITVQHRNNITKLKNDLLNKYIDKNDFSVIMSENKSNKSKSISEIIHQDINNAISLTVELKDDDLLYDSDKVRSNMKKTLKNIDFKELNNISEFKQIELTPEEILFLKYINNRIVSDYDYSLSWYYRYELNIEDAFYKLFNGGYIKFGDLESKLKALKINDLKPLLRENNLKLSGKKDILIKRLLDNVDYSILDSSINFDVFAHTDLGKETLINSEYILYFDRKSSFDISLKEAMDVKKCNPNFNHYSIALYIFEKRLKRYEQKNNSFDYYKLEHVYENLSEIYCDLGTTDKELFYLIASICVNMSNPYSIISEYKVEKIQKIAKKSGINSKELISLIDKTINQLGYKINKNMYNEYMDYFREI